MNEDSKSQAQVSISLVDVFSSIWKIKFIAVFIVAVFLVAGFVYGTYFVKPKYVSEAKLVALGVSDTGKVSSNDVAVGTYLVNDYCEMVVDRSVLTTVIKELNLKMTPEQLNSMISVKNPDESRILDVYVSSRDPNLSKKINSKLCDVARRKISDALGADKITIFSDANLPASNSSIKPSTYTVLATVCGIIVVFLLAVVITLFNDKIKNEEDVERYLGLCTLATIPYNVSKKKRTSLKRKAAKQ